jgi:hypothetical protein
MAKQIIFHVRVEVVAEKWDDTHWIVKSVSSNNLPVEEELMDKDYIRDMADYWLDDRVFDDGG